MAAAEKTAPMSRSYVLLGTAAATTAVLVVVAALTDLQFVFHRVMIGLAVAAFWPFMLIAVGLAVFVAVLGLMLLLAALTDGAVADAPGGVPGSDFMELGAELIKPYYSFVLGIRHPIFWGIPAGLLVGCLSLGAYLAITVYLPESNTVGAMAEGQAYIEAYYDEHSRLPAPEDGHLVLADGQPLTDGFGNPVRYEVSGHWRVATWALRSAGADGDFETAQDFCLEGGTRAAELVQFAADALDRLRDSESPHRDRLQGIVEMRC